MRKKGRELKIDTRKLVWHFGGRTPCHTLLKEGGYEISIKTVEKWMENESIPSKRILQLADCSDRILNQPFDIREFFVKQ